MVERSSVGAGRVSFLEQAAEAEGGRGKRKVEVGSARSSGQAYVRQLLLCWVVKKKKKKNGKVKKEAGWW